MSNTRLDNARDDEQRRRMQEADSKGVCYFCELFRKPGEEKFLFIGNHWFIKKNDFPYTGSVHHYLIVSQKHLTTVEQLSGEPASELFEAIRFLSANLDASGFSLFVRSGDMAFTGASLAHLHFQFLIGVEKPNPGEPDNPELTIFAPLGYKEQK
jgi:diadenosine tetraphosphate (Ap4A) HIT family hydrolase